MTTKEQIKVMQAYVDGKSIEIRYKGDENWVETKFPSWDWQTYEFRVKEEPKYRPYNSAEEFLQASKKHGPYIKCPNDELIMPCRINHGMIEWSARFSSSNNNQVLLFKSFTSLLNDKYKWQDETPCGIFE